MMNFFFNLNLPRFNFVQNRDAAAVENKQQKKPLRRRRFRSKIPTDPDEAFATNYFFGNVLRHNGQ